MRIIYCFKRSFSTTPALLSGDTGKGVNVGRTSEMGFKRRCPGPPGPSPAGLRRGTAAELGTSGHAFLQDGFYLGFSLVYLLYWAI